MPRPTISSYKKTCRLGWVEAIKTVAALRRVQQHYCHCCSSDSGPTGPAFCADLSTAAQFRGRQPAGRSHTVHGRSGQGQSTALRCDSLQSVLSLLFCAASYERLNDGDFPSEFLIPVLESCVPLMKARSYSQPVVAAILVLIQNITTKVSIYVDDKVVPVSSYFPLASLRWWWFQDDSATLYRMIVMIVDVYRSEQASRFIGMTENDEDKGSDLVSWTHRCPYLTFAELHACGARVDLLHIYLFCTWTATRLRQRNKIRSNTIRTHNNSKLNKWFGKSQKKKQEPLLFWDFVGWTPHPRIGIASKNNL